MQLPGLIGFISVLILACNSDDKSWKINVNKNITAHPGSNITIQCNFSYPQKYKTDNVTVYWKNLKVKDISNCSKNEKDKNAFVYHPNEICVINNYIQKTKLIGDKDKGDCSLQITNIVMGEQKLYVRIHVKEQNYSYTNDYVTISQRGKAAESDKFKPVGTDYMNPTFSPTETTITNEEGHSTDIAKTLYVAIPVAVAAVIILLVAGIFFFQKHKRSHSVTREDSGYYANFSRAISNPPKREACVSTQVKKLPEGKAIDDPVYINVKAPPGHMDQNMDCVDNIYANMDYRN
ncbi:uncharacterized protein LOC115794888 [Archocentrus centrarchus]|uniref:uncharacterized protein LOC115794888 n=1 Tax=Archocentrus centrarchus TaxID=63155 RepID=UPI0011E9ED79|nr:uncharacterized protein LOC115794888 [Archocentrus centrarchus]